MVERYGVVCRKRRWRLRLSPFLLSSIVKSRGDVRCFSFSKFLVDEA